MKSALIALATVATVVAFGTAALPALANGSGQQPVWICTTPTPTPTSTPPPPVAEPTIGPGPTGTAGPDLPPVAGPGPAEGVTCSLFWPEYPEPTDSAEPTPTYGG